MLCAENVFTNLHLTEFYICRIVHRENCDMCRNLHLCFCAQCRFVISAFGKIFALQICAFCARRFFAHLHICTFVFCTCAQKFYTCEKVFVQVASLWKCFRECARTCRNGFEHFSQNLQIWAFFAKMTKKSKFPKMSRKCPKKAHVFLSGTRVVPGPTRLTTQGGKSRQNMH